MVSDYEAKGAGSARYVSHQLSVRARIPVTGASFSPSRSLEGVAGVGMEDARPAGRGAGFGDQSSHRRKCSGPTPSCALRAAILSSRGREPPTSRANQTALSFPTTTVRFCFTVALSALRALAGRGRRRGGGGESRCPGRRLTDSDFDLPPTTPGELAVQLGHPDAGRAVRRVLHAGFPEHKKCARGGNLSRPGKTTCGRTSRRDADRRRVEKHPKER